MDPCSSTTHCAVEFLGAYQPQSTAFMPVGNLQQQQMPLPPSLTRVDGDGFSDSDTDETRTPTQSDAPGQSQRRKLRRGRIEKRRRDRINLCLAELRRLVPAAFEKQGSQKLEKAEILQLTVEHLKFLHSTGVNTLLYDTPDYRSAGFRACASEVDRYLTEREGMDIQDPRRDKLERYLQCNGTQQMAQNKAAAVVGWPNCHPQTHVPTTAQQVFTHPTTPTSIYPHPSSTATYPRPINIDTKQFAATIYPHQTGFAFQGLTAGPQMQNL